MVVGLVLFGGGLRRNSQVFHRENRTFRGSLMSTNPQPEPAPSGPMDTLPQARSGITWKQMAAAGAAVLTLLAGGVEGGRQLGHSQQPPVPATRPTDDQLIDRAVARARLEGEGDRRAFEARLDRLEELLKEVRVDVREIRNRQVRRPRREPRE